MAAWLVARGSCVSASTSIVSRTHHSPPQQLHTCSPLQSRASIMQLWTILMNVVLVLDKVPHRGVSYLAAPYDDSLEACCASSSSAFGRLQIYRNKNIY